MRCQGCGKEIETQNALFCPFCGQNIPKAESPEEVRKWIGSIERASTIIEKAKMVEKARRELGENCPEIEWEALFIGRKKKAPKHMVDFSVIKSYLLHIYLTPKDFARELKDEMRREIFHDPQLEKCLSLCGDDNALFRYLTRLSVEFIELFLNGNARYSKTIFGIALDSKKERTLAAPAAMVIRNIKEDGELTEEERKLLSGAFYAGFKDWTKGRTQWLDQELEKE